MDIKTMTIDDYDDVYKLWTSEKSVGLRSLDDSKEGIRKFLNRNPDTCFTAAVDNKIIGCIMCGNDGRRAYIYHAMVHKDYRGNGIGKKMLDTAISALKKEGINKAALVVYAHNELGNRFWEREGFTTREDLVYRNKSLNEDNL